MRDMPTEVIVPYGNPNGALHFRFANDYKTFCGRECETWLKADTTLAQAVNSAFTCKSCMKALHK